MRLLYFFVATFALCATWSERAGSNAQEFSGLEGLEHSQLGSKSRTLLQSGKELPGGRFAHSGGNLTERFTRFDYEMGLGGEKTVKVENFKYPFRAIGQLESGCSAFLVGPCHLLTVAHCIYEPDYNFWWGGTTFHAGRSGPSQWSPHGGAAKKRALVPPGWKHGKDFDHDYAMLVLYERIGDKVGWLDFGYDLDQKLVRANVAGYPAYEDEPAWVNGTMYYDSCRAQFNYENSRDRVAYHNCDTVGGSSGSPIWVYDEERDLRQVRALHSHAAKLRSGSVPTAVQFREDVFDRIQQWKRENECQ